MGSRDRRIVLLGRSGVGKSSAGNTIFGEEEVFQTEDDSSTICQAETRSIEGRKITLIDTPGFCQDDDTPEDQFRFEIMRSIKMGAPGPHAFVIVLEVEAYTQQEQDVVDKMAEYFSSRMFDYATVLFTYGYQLKGKTIREWSRGNALLSALLSRCGNRYHVVDNEFWNDSDDSYRDNRYQVGQLLSTIDRMVVENQMEQELGAYFTR